MNREKKPSQRGSKFIDRQVQGRIVARCVLHWLAFVVGAASLGLLIQFCVNPFAGVRENLLRFWTAFGPTLAVLVCLMPIFVNDFVKFSNRIVGPVARTRKVLQGIAQGEVIDPVRFRDDDFHSAIANDLNAVIDLVNRAKEPKPDSQSQLTGV
jgi:heme exporter protein D